MKIFAYCGQSFAEATQRITGVEPLVCPPAAAEYFDPHRLEGYDLLYFDFHGLPGVPYWFEETLQRPFISERTVALRAAQVRQVDLGDTLVMALSCYLGDSQSPMLDALLEAGATYVIGGDGQNWASKQDVTGAGILARRFIKAVADGKEPLVALAEAKRAVKRTLIKDVAMLRFKRVKAAKDTLGFRAYYRKE